MGVAQPVAPGDLEVVGHGDRRRPEGRPGAVEPAYDVAHRPGHARAATRQGSGSACGADGRSSSWWSTVARRGSTSPRWASTQRRQAVRPGSTKGPIRTAPGSTASQRWETSSRIERVGDGTPRLADGDHQSRCGRRSRAGETGGGAGTHHSVATVASAATRRSAAEPGAAPLAPGSRRVDHPAVGDQAGRRRRGARRVGGGRGGSGRACRPGRSAQDEPVGRVEPDLEVPVVTAYDVEPVAQHGPGQVAPCRRCHAVDACHSERRPGDGCPQPTTRADDRDTAQTAPPEGSAPS